MKKLLSLFLIIVMLIISIAACSEKKDNKTDTCIDVEFEIVDKDEIPQKLKEKIFEKKEKKFGLTYRNGEELYIAVGYGTQLTGGYSIKIISLKECGNKIVLNTELIEPSKEDVVSTVETYPYIVIKTKDNELDVNYELN